MEISFWNDLKKVWSQNAFFSRKPYLNFWCDQIVSHTFEAGNKLFFFGNGGSAADAQHLAAHVNRYVMDRPPLPAICLTTTPPFSRVFPTTLPLTKSFLKQLRALGKKGMCDRHQHSGSSPNVIKAFEVAKEMGMKTVALTGNDGGALQNGWFSPCCPFDQHTPYPRDPYSHRAHPLWNGGTLPLL